MMIMLLRGSRFFLRFSYVFPFDKGLVNCRIEAGFFFLARLLFIHTR